MNTIREIEKINQEELKRGIAGTSASWHAQYVNSAWCYVGNLDHSLTEGDVLCIMSQFGEIDDIHLVRDDSTGKSRGFGFVKYEDARSCVLAVDNFVGTQVLGRSLRVDHVEQYRLPKKLQEQNEQKENEQQQKQGESGHAYQGVELENEYSVNEGMDLFAPVASDSSPKAVENHREKDDSQDSKALRKLERKRKREEKEKRQKQREERRKRKEEKNRQKRRHPKDDSDNVDSIERGSGDERHDKTKKKLKHKHDKKSTINTRKIPVTFNIGRLLALWLFSTQNFIMAWISNGGYIATLSTKQNPLFTSRRLCMVRRKQPNWSEPPVALDEELGCSPTLSLLLFNKSQRHDVDNLIYFDPLNLATDDNFAIYREAELKHGRVAMISVVSCIVSTLVKECFPKIVNGDRNLEQLWSTMLSNFMSHPATQPSTLMSSPSPSTSTVEEVIIKVPVHPQQLFLSLSVPSPMVLLQDWTVGDYLRMIVVCGFIETFVWVQTDPTDMPGDYQVGYWGIRDKALHERSLICELENGRLAMMAMLYYIGLDIYNVFVDQQ